MTRRSLAITILAVWLVSLGWLVKRLAFRPPGARLAEAALSVPPGAAYYRLMLGGQQVGFASSTIDTTTTGLRVTDLLILRFPAAGVLRRSAILTEAKLSRALRLETLDAKYAVEAGSFAAKGSVTGDSLLTITVAAGRDSQTTRVPIPRPAVLPALLPLHLAFGGELKSGRTYSSGVFDPVRLAARWVRVDVARESTLVVADSAEFDSTAMAWIPAHFDTVQAFQISETEGGVTTQAWIDAQGRVVRAETPAGFTTERAAFELAYENYRHRDTTHLGRSTAHPPPGSIVATTVIAAGAVPPLDTLPLLRVRLSGAALAGFALTGGRQRLEGDTLEVRRESAEGADAPLAARYRLPARDTAFRAALAPEPLIQRDDPRVEAQARLIVGHEDDPARVARLIGDWVHRNVERHVGTGMPSAVEVLEQRRGDCNEQTVLYVALARAVGLPARTVAGLVYVGGRFYYHAWPEVFLADWVAVDPTFGQFPADAAHLRVAIGGLARQVELLRLIGSLKLEVL